jgi:hypothetical protein
MKRLPDVKPDRGGGYGNKDDPEYFNKLHAMFTPVLIVVILADPGVIRGQLNIVSSGLACVGGRHIIS